MTEIHVESSPAAPSHQLIHVHETHHGPPDDGLDLVLVVIALTILVVLVALIFYVLPGIVGTPAVNVNIRSP